VNKPAAFISPGEILAARSTPLPGALQLHRALLAGSVALGKSA
jgi:hypothetical protein